jgi:predicted transcriptional regulator
MNKVDLEILKELRKAGYNMHVTQLSTRASISIAELAKSITKLQDAQIVGRDGGKIFVTDAGREWLKHNQSLFTFSGEKTWRMVPEIFKGRTIQAYEPYVPSIRRLRQKFFGVGKQ